MNYTKYNKEEILEAELEELIQKLKNICVREKIPLLVSLCYKNTKDKSFYRNEIVSSRSNNIFLTDDKFKDYINVINGFTTIPKRNELLIEEDMISKLFNNIDD